MKLFLNMLSIICVFLGTEFRNTSENFYFAVILVQDPVSCEFTNVTNHYINVILDLDEEFNFQRHVCLDSNRKHYNQSKFVDSMFARGTVAIQNEIFHFFGHKRDPEIGMLIVQFDIQELT